MPYGTPEPVGRGHVKYRAVVRNATGTPNVLFAEVVFGVEAETWDAAAEAEADAKFQAFIDLIDASPDFETAPFPSRESSHKWVTVASEVTPTPAPLD